MSSDHDSYVKNVTVSEARKFKMAPPPSKSLRDEDVAKILEESDIGDFVPSDEDFGDPAYVPMRQDNSVSSFSGSESESGEDAEESVRGRGRGRTRVRVGRRATSGRLPRGRGRERARGRARGGARLQENAPSPSGSIQNEWCEQDFLPKSYQLAEPAYLPNNTDGFTKTDYFKQYFNDDLYVLCVEKTNQTAVKLTGSSLNLTVRELKLYFALNLVMASVNYPILRMYWMNRWRISIVADNMSRNRYQQLRNSLKFVFDDDIPPEMKAKDKIYKVRPLIDQIQLGCRLQDKSQLLSVDEMIIPFTGTCGIRQFCPGKPNPTGLKAFVLAKPNGVVCDFHIYQGTTTYPELDNTVFGLGEKAVLTLADPLVPGHILYFDRYFTSQRLIDELSNRNIGCTGTIMSNRIPRECQPKDDRAMKAEGRGSSQVLVRPDGQLAFTKWFDNKSVNFLSSVEAETNSDFCQRYCKLTKRYLTVPRPQVVREYNRNMGGVDLADRLLAVCPNRYKTKKWTQRIITHMTDLAVSNCWLQYKRDEEKKGTPMKKVLMLREFKLQLGEELVGEITEVSTANEPQSSDDENDEQIVNAPRKRGKPAVVLPSKTSRVCEAKHMPILEEKQSRCRSCHYNKTHFKCGTCNIFLCLTKVRNCYADFHSKET